MNTILNWQTFQSKDTFEDTPYCPVKSKAWQAYGLTLEGHMKFEKQFLMAQEMTLYEYHWDFIKKPVSC